MAQLQVTQLLDRLRLGDEHAWEELIPLVYGEMRDVARQHRQRERPNHTLQTTALVHEAYLRLQPTRNSWESRAHFLAAAAVAVGRILVDHARREDRLKRGGGQKARPLQEADGMAAPSMTELLALSEALDQLGQLDVRQRRVVEMKYFARMTISEIADVLEISESTVEDDWRVAKMWLRRTLADRTKDDE